MPTKLYVGNISNTVNQRELAELFEKYGKVLDCTIIKDFAFVHMEDSSKAKASIAALNDFNLNGNRIRVEMSIGQNRPSNRSSRREDETDRHNSSSMGSSRRNRDYSPISSSRNGGSGGGRPDRSYPSIKHDHIGSRSRPYDSPYDRPRISASTHYSDSYRNSRAAPFDSYSRNDYYHQRPPSMSMSDPYGRGPSMRSNYDSYHSYSPGSSSFGSSASLYPVSSSPSSRHDSARYGPSSRRPSRRSPSPLPPSSRSRR